MYLRHLQVRNVKLLRDVKVDFVGADDRPRMWTVFVGENRLCKTTLLQTIAAAACGQDRGTQLVTDVIASWPDLRDPVPLSIEAEFGFSETRNKHRRYPELPRDAVKRAGKNLVPQLWSRLELAPDNRVFQGISGYIGDATTGDPLAVARRLAFPDWFVAGYGPSRLLPGAGKTARQSEPTLDRLRPLFGESLIGTGFIELLGEELGRSFVKVLEAVFVTGELLPHVTALELRGRGGIRSGKDLADAQSFEMDLLDIHGKRIRVPATWLSQGYQSLIAWLADLVGQILLDAGEPVEAADMEGTVLVDEIDVHLHPTWQVRLIPALKKVFPRLQFIATTHSPMVLPALAAEEIYLLSQDAEGNVTAQPSAKSPALLTGSELYDAFFDIRKLYPEALGDKLHRYGNLATDPTRTAEEDATMRALKQDLEAAGVAFDWSPVEREAGGVIRIARAPEPAALAPVRNDRLVAARDAIFKGTKIDFKEYDIVKSDLAAMQHNKCCYCEKREEQAKYRDVEHYRPKSLYWWLAWTWENLLFACIDCNREQKRDKFPQEPTSTPLIAEQAPPSGERPLVIDPSDPNVEPTMEIVFLRERIHGKERWTPRGMSARGRKTVEVCGLDRPNLLDLYADHVNHTVRAKLARFFSADAEGDAQAAFKTWETARRGLLGHERPFRALSYDALNVLVPAPVRERYRLVLEPPAP